MDDIAEIKAVITPIMVGSANKERINLINSFITAITQVKKDPEDKACLAKVIELLRSFIIELISAIRNSN